MKLFTFGFWSGFLDRTNPGHVGFFIELFEKVFNCEIEISNNMNECDILLETIFSNTTKLFDKQWKYTFLFSGESRLCRFKDNYSCILWGERNHDNVVNVPEFVHYLYSNKLVELMKNPVELTSIPKKNICAIISNGGGLERNAFLEKLEKKIPVDYAGEYKNNRPRIDFLYNTQDFRNEISNYKFIISMENSREDTYVTEKITHGLLSNVIPVYWGSLRVEDYFNKDRFINIKNMDEDTINEVINKIEKICNDDELFMDVIKNPNFNNNLFNRTIDNIARDVRNVINSRRYKTIDQIYIISSPEFEPDRYVRLKNMFENAMQVPEDNLSFICPTYKHTLSDEIMKESVKMELVKNVRDLPMKKAEVSLFFNYKAVLEHIETNYKDGNFLIFESDVLLINTENSLDYLFEFVNKKRNSWDLIHIGYGGEKEIFESPYCCGKMPYRDAINNINMNFIEDITTSSDPIRMIRKYHTRCCDSFLWNYKGVVKFLNHMNEDINYGAPFDYYMTNKLEIDDDFKHYWTTVPFFLQGSNYGYFASTIQRDVI